MINSILIQRQYNIPTFILFPGEFVSCAAISWQPCCFALWGRCVSSSHFLSAAHEYKGAGVAWLIRDVVTIPVALPYSREIMAQVLQKFNLLHILLKLTVNWIILNEDFQCNILFERPP